ncbi:MAG: MOSC domain-containing protein [Hyphomicrobium sp.]|nr:MAG: MOSC domain-containing protein [Hyphomicrobium sp.]PPD01843.1 MAG: MOSC domain-containing protein [Hyphomicrobium sp.]
MTTSPRKTPSPDSPLGRLLAAPARPGTLMWIGVRPVRKAALVSLSSAELIAEHGIRGDHYETRHNGARQVTLIASEDIAAIASFIGRETIGPELLRRNLVTRGINLAALKGRQLRVGDAVLDISGDCAPCSRMEDTLGIGGYNAVRGRGGVTARILTGGIVRIGDTLTVVDVT